ncbi:MAG: class I SAM-dependent methyltransferase [Anaerolineales bacterium]|nr:class I SAM-dependent methyltransferase [Anaerolineales bacterium]
MNEFDAKAKAWDSTPGRAERARTVADAIRARVPITPDLRALEYGCGTGLLSFALQPRLGRITLADSSAGMLEVLAQKISAARIRNMVPLRLDLSADPPPAERFQIIYTLMTLHHIPDTAGILRAFFRMLEAPGYLCIADLDREDGSFHGPDFTGHQGFDREALKTIALQAGFGDVACETVFQVARETAADLKHFPLFLMTARRRD